MKHQNVLKVDLDERFVIPADGSSFSKCRWTPYAGKVVYGAVRRVVLRGEEAYVDGKVGFYGYFAEI